VNAVMDEIRSWPFLWAWLVLFAIVLLRAGATYGLGRLVAAGVVTRWAPGERVQRAVDRVHRWGPPVVALSFLTVGAQSAVNAAAGLARMPVPRYLLGLVPGAAIWATVWSTVGFAAFYAAVELSEGRPGSLAVVLVTALVIAALVVVSGRSGRRG
jgi:membrane protein DedA with SNARE-associated domain